MRTKRDDIKRKYNTYFNELGWIFNTELIISEKPGITKYEDYEYRIIHNFYFNFKNGVVIYMEVLDVTKQILYLSVKIKTLLQKKIASNMLLKIDSKYKLSIADIIINDDYINTISLSDIKPTNIDNNDDNDDDFTEISEILLEDVI